MQNALLSKVLLLAICALVGGCQVIGTPNLSRAGKVQEQLLANAKAQVETQQGRGHLLAGRNGLAIDAFNRALVFGEAPAPALNGLGVAYARLGRSDLAFRFFQQAVKADPASALFAKNLATLTNSGNFTLAALRSAPGKAAPQANPFATSPVIGKLHRGDNRQVMLVTRPAGTPASACAVTFKGMSKMACGTPNLPVIAVRNKPQAAETMNAVEPAGSDLPRAGSRKVVTISAIDPVPTRTGFGPIGRSLRQ